MIFNKCAIIGCRVMRKANQFEYVFSAFNEFNEVNDFSI